MAARMNNQYEERLGTERMLPLIFKMALPAVAAQFVNLLYNIVDRIYIGHIPEIGTNALAGVGVTTSIVILISSFSAIVGAGGAPLAAMALGQGDRVRAGKFLGNGFMLLILFGTPELVSKFKQYKETYQKERDIEIDDHFATVSNAIKRKATGTMTTIKLDKNFDINIHGGEQYIERGYDEERGMYYYQLFFREER